MEKQRLTHSTQNLSAKWHALKIALVSWFSLFFENASPNCFHGLAIVAFALLFSWVPVIGRDSPIVKIFSWTIITVFVIDTKPVLICGTVAWKPQNAPWRHTGDVNWNAVAILMLDNCGYQTDRKIYYQSQIAPCLRSSRSRQNYKFASASLGINWWYDANWLCLWATYKLRNQSSIVIQLANNSLPLVSPFWQERYLNSLQWWNVWEIFYPFTQEKHLKFYCCSDVWHFCIKNRIR